MIKIVFDKKLFAWLTAGFILFTVVGTLSHESGHYIMARLLGYKASVNYKSTWFDFDKSNHESILTREKDVAKDSVLITAGGPLQTILTGTIGLGLLVWSRKRFPSENLSVTQWLLIFITLFWLREVFNFFGSLGYYLFNNAYSRRGDEFQLAYYFHIHPLSFAAPLAVPGTLVLGFVVFRIIPVAQRFTFLAAGLVGGISGYYLWMEVFGPILLP